MFTFLPRKKLLPWVMSILWTVVALCVPSCSDNTPILIGFSGQLTGKMSDLGVHGRNGAMLAVEQINAAGGIEGRSLKLIAKDDGNTPESAIAADKWLVEQGVVAIVGHMTSAQTLAVYPFLNSIGTVLVSPTTSTPQLSGKADTFFRVILENTIHSRELATYARKALDIQTAVTIAESDNKSFTFTFSNGFAETFTDHDGKILDQVSYSSQQHENWDEIVTILRRLKPDAVQLSMPAQDAASLLQRIRSTDLNGVRVLSSPWAYTENMLRWGGRDAEGVIYAIDYSPDNPNPNFIRFREAYRNRFGSLPNFASAFGYESVLALAQGLKDTHGSAKGLADAMAPSRLINGVISDFRLNEFGDVERSIFISTIQEGTFKTIEMR